MANHLLPLAARLNMFVTPEVTHSTTLDNTALETCVDIKGHDGMIQLGYFRSISEITAVVIEDDYVT